MPNSRFALHSLALGIHGLCAIFPSNSRFMRLFQARLDTCLDSLLLCQPLSSRFALHSLRALETKTICPKTTFLCSRSNNRRRESQTNFYFSNFSGSSGISRQNPGISRPKCLISLVSRDIPNFLAPTNSRGRPPTRPANVRTKKFGFGFLFQKPGNHPNFRKNALGAKRPFSELWESSGVFSEQLSEFKK